jgi:flavin-dependent dehydrogenase
LRRILERWLEENGFPLNGAHFYSHILPSFRPQTFETLEVSGEGWAMIGDSAGLVDPITGEGLYYALRSAELCANALLAERPEDYRSTLREEVLSELKLAAQVSDASTMDRFLARAFWSGWCLSPRKAQASASLMSDLFAGTQGYRDLRARLYKILPSALAESLAGMLRRPWSRSSANFAIDLAETP